jgi:outer membrane receptor protein involved in Fe transport
MKGTSWVLGVLLTGWFTVQQTQQVQAQQIQQASRQQPRQVQEAPLPTYTHTHSHTHVVGQPQTAEAPDSLIELQQVTVLSPAKLVGEVMAVDLAMNPVNSSQDLLRRTPGLFIAQHAGGGKAEQIFLRGFDVDHGTDVALSVDGLPVNMVSHAHGQGYSDLHFVIPETVESIDFGKGSYYADKGDFATAGYVALKTFDHIDRSSVKLEGGMFGTMRMTGLLSLFGTCRHRRAEPLRGRRV